MIEVHAMVHAIEHNNPDLVHIEWRKGSSEVFPNKKPVELYLQITNDPEKFLNKMDARHKNELRGGFKWPADNLGLALQRSNELMRHYGCMDVLPTPAVDENLAIFLAAEVIYRGTA